MTENNLRVLKPWRAYIPSFTQLQHRAKVKRLNGYITQLLHKRWATRQSQGSKDNLDGYQDVLGRIMQALEVHQEAIVDCHHCGMSSNAPATVRSATQSKHAQSCLQIRLHVQSVSMALLSLQMICKGQWQHKLGSWLKAVASLLHVVKQEHWSNESMTCACLSAAQCCIAFRAEYEPDNGGAALL